jgi:hypothetical protein
MGSCTRVLSILLAALCVLAGPADATQVISKSVEQLGGESESVVRGKVTDVRSFWNDKHTKIFTEVFVEVDETYKGGNLRTVRLLQLGGTVEPVKMTVHGALQWRVDEEVLLFLEPYQGAYHVSGFSQGKFPIERDKRTGEPFIRRMLDDGPAPVSGSSLHRRAVNGRTPLDRFVDHALGRKGGAR